MKDIEVLEEMKNQWEAAKESRLRAAKQGEYDEAQLAIDCVRDNRYISALNNAIEIMKRVEYSEGLMNILGGHFPTTNIAECDNQRNAALNLQHYLRGESEDRQSIPNKD